MAKPGAPKKSPKKGKEVKPSNVDAAQASTDDAKKAGRRSVDKAKDSLKADDKRDKVDKTKDKETSDMEKRVNEVLGAGFMYDLKKILFLWQKLWTEDLPGIGDKLENWMRRTDMSKLRKETEDAEKRVKVPKLNKRKEDLKTKLAIMNNSEPLIKYLYASLGIDMPKLEDVKQLDKNGKEVPVKELKLKHLLKQLKEAKLGHLQGPRAILKEVKKRPPYFYKGDLMIVQSSTGKLTAGFVEAMDDNVVYIRNNQDSKPQKFFTNQLFLAFHIPGNKRKGNEIPKKLTKPKKKKSKED